MLDYAALSALAAVVREGSFDRAAATLGVTPSAVSQRIRALEERVGSILVVRGQPCTATVIGAQLCAHVDRVLLLEGEMATALPALAGEAGQQGPATLRVALNADSLSTWFLTAAAAFAAETGALLDLVIDHEGNTAEHLRAGEVLAAVTADSPQVQGCRMIQLGALRFVATAAPAFVQSWFPGGVDAAALAQAPMLRFDRKDPLQARWLRDVAGADLAGAVHAEPPQSAPTHFPPTHWIPTTQGGVDAALVGLGWAINPLPLVRDHLASGKLVDLSPGWHVDLPFQWQHARIGTVLLVQLTQAVLAAAKQMLVA